LCPSWEHPISVPGILPRLASDQDKSTGTSGALVVDCAVILRTKGRTLEIPTRRLTGHLDVWTFPARIHSCKPSLGWHLSPSLSLSAVALNALPTFPTSSLGHGVLIRASPCPKPTSNYAPSTLPTHPLQFQGSSATVNVLAWFCSSSRAGPRSLFLYLVSGQRIAPPACVGLRCSALNRQPAA
jgi:hypothetical protein